MAVANSYTLDEVARLCLLTGIRHACPDADVDIVVYEDNALMQRIAVFKVKTRSGDVEGVLLPLDNQDLSLKTYTDGFKIPDEIIATVMLLAG